MGQLGKDVSFSGDRALQVTKEPGSPIFTGVGRLWNMAHYIFRRLVRSAVPQVQYLKTVHVRINAYGGDGDPGWGR